MSAWQKDRSKVGYLPPTTVVDEVGLLRLAMEPCGC